MDYKAMLIEWINLGLSQDGKDRRGLASALGIDKNTISKILSGLRDLKAHELPVIAEYFGIPAPFDPASAQNNFILPLLKANVRQVSQGSPDIEQQLLRTGLSIVEYYRAEGKTLDADALNAALQAKLAEIKDRKGTNDKK